jgi:gamma-glutamylputrescine oxidase
MDLLTANDRPGHYPQSYYAATAKGMPTLHTARGDIKVDVCIIGGGYTGVSSALHLAEKGYTVALLEANRVGWGASGRNGGQVNTGMRLPQTDLEDMFGRQRAHDFYHFAEEAVARVKDLVTRHGIDCGLKPGVIHASHRKRYVEHERDYVRLMTEDYGVDSMRFLERDEMRALVPSDFYHGGVLDMAAAHLHPLNYLLGLARAAIAAGAQLFEQSRVIEIVEGSPARVRTEHATITADHVIIGCNGYSGGLNGEIARHVMPINGFIAATRPLTEAEAEKILTADHAVADSKFVINYYRFSEDRRLLFGGGESYGYRFPANIDAVVRKPMEEVYPHLAGIEFDYCWGGTLGITMNRLPFVRRLSGNVITASGFSGQGVAMATMAGSMLADVIAGQAAF